MSPGRFRRMFRIPAFTARRAREEMDDEIRIHLEMRAAQFRAQGYSPEDAMAEARRRFGSVDDATRRLERSAVRRHHRLRVHAGLSALRHDVRYALRGLRRSPGFTTAAIVTLALGIGATTAVFTVVNALILRPLAYPHADRVRLVVAEPSGTAFAGRHVYVSTNPPTLGRWRASARTFDDLEGFATATRVFRIDGGAASVVHTAAVEPGLAELAGQRPLLGRFITASDVATAFPVAVLSEGLWRGRFGGAPSVVGRTISLDRATYTVIGVMPAAFDLPPLFQDHTDVFVPLERDESVVQMIARLRPGVADVSAAHELDALAADVPGAGASLPTHAVVLAPGRTVAFRGALLVLASAVVLVLVIACVNVAHLLLARGTARSREMAIRAAVGAGRGRLVRQVLTESMVLALGGCLGGLATGWGELHILIGLRPGRLSQLAAVRASSATLLAGVALAVVTGVVFGLVGALQATRLASPVALRVGAPTAAHGPRGGGRAGLIVSQMVACTALLVAAVLLIRTVERFRHADLGFRPAGLYAVSADLAATADSTGPSAWRFYDGIAARVQRLPGIEGVTVASAAPPGFSFAVGTLEAQGSEAPPRTSGGFVNVVGIRTDYFKILGVQFLEGGTFTDTTAAGAQVVINAGMARRYWPNGSAIGRRVRIAAGGKGDWLTVVGVVRDAATSGGLLSDRAEPILYLPAASSSSTPTLIVRVTNPAAVLPAIRAIVSSADAAVPPVQITSITNAMAHSIDGIRFTMLLLGAFSIVALALGAVGVYGVVSYAVARRTREIGVRLALGATAGAVARDVLARGLVPVVVGLGIGLGVACWGAVLLSTAIAGVTTADPAAFVLAAGVLLAAALVACLVPMRRAVRVDPLVAMRVD